MKVQNIRNIFALSVFFVYSAQACNLNKILNFEILRKSPYSLKNIQCKKVSHGYQFKLVGRKKSITSYGGVDSEKLSSFNTNEGFFILDLIRVPSNNSSQVEVLKNRTYVWQLKFDDGTEIRGKEERIASVPDFTVDDWEEENEEMDRKTASVTSREDGKKTNGSRSARRLRNGQGNRYFYSRWKYSAFYTLSIGSLEEKIKGSNISAISNQDSPITLGAAAFKKLSPNLNYSGSFFVSKFNNATSDLNEEVSIPLELGITSYIGFKGTGMPAEIYSGLDVEKLSSFNTDELPTGSSLSTREHTLTNS